MSQNRIKPEAGFCNQSALPKGPNGFNLCRWCSKECPGKARTFCSQECVHEWRLRSDPGYVRAQVYKRDKGFCATCGVDGSSTKELAHKLYVLAHEAAQRGDHDEQSNLLSERSRVLQNTKPSNWDADHIIPVIEGGGECGLENYRTLCKPCHKQATKELAARRAAKRRAEKEVA